MKEIRNLTDSEKLDWLRLIRSENVGPKGFQNLLGKLGGVKQALELAPDMSVKGGRSKPIKICSIQAAKKEIELTKEFGAKIIAACEPDYPKILRQIDDYPPVITVFGDSSKLNDSSIAIVGARNSSANGCNFAKQIAAALSREKVFTISGLARGIDTFAHQGSLDFGTLAVVAGGIDKIYPPENKDLFHEIAKKGAVITEMPFGSAPRAQNFPRRNRIISGMSLGVVIVEAAKKSGSLITARYALEHNKEVFAIPGSPSDARSAGTNDLIKDGAYMVTKPEDVTDVVERLIVRQSRSLFEEAPIFVVPKLMPISQEQLSKARPIVANKIGSSPTAIDDVISQTGFTPNIVLTIILELELAGRLQRHMGNKISMIYNPDCEQKILF